MAEHVKQCKTCPWRVGARLANIPGYDHELHQNLVTSTIGEPGDLRGAAARMACHHSPKGREHVCAGLALESSRAWQQPCCAYATNGRLAALG